MLLIKDFQEDEVVLYNHCKAKILKIKRPSTLYIENLEFPKSNWVSAELDCSSVEKINNKIKEFN